MSNVPIVSKKRAGSKKSQSQSAGSPFPVDILPGLFHCDIAPFPFIPGIPVPWYEAVWVFYCFSGFYMALILNLKYTEGHTLFFYANRWLRIWPMYLGSLLLLGAFVYKTGVVCSMTCIDVHLFGRMLTFLPEGWRAAIIGSNLFLFGLDAQWALDFPLPVAGESQEFVRLALYDKFNTNAGRNNNECRSICFNKCRRL
jgi:hypothetical protein